MGDTTDYLADESVNPKQQAATRDQKPPLHLLEYAADTAIAKVLAHGAQKYGRKNFHDTPILANVYGGAIRRHVGAWLDGEDIDPESGLPHLAHIGANIHVLFAAQAHGTFQDDRGPEPRSAVQQRMSDASNSSTPENASPFNAACRTCNGGDDCCLKRADQGSDLSRDAARVDLDGEGLDVADADVMLLPGESWVESFDLRCDVCGGPLNEQGQCPTKVSIYASAGLPL